MVVQSVENRRECKAVDPPRGKRCGLGHSTPRPLSPGPPMPILGTVEIADLRCPVSSEHAAIRCPHLEAAERLLRPDGLFRVFEFGMLCRQGSLVRFEIS